MIKCPKCKNPLHQIGSYSGDQDMWIEGITPNLLAVGCSYCNHRWKYIIFRMNEQ